MLAGALSYVAVIALVAASILTAGLAMTRGTLTRMAQTYLSAGYQRAAASLQQTAASTVQNGGPFPLPAFTPMPPACANAACTYTTTATIALSQASPATPGPSCDASHTACASNVEVNRYVSEGRLSATITVNVLDARGALVASRSSDVLLRTFAAPPYAALAGSREGTFDDVAGPVAAGDDGGAPAATPNPCAASTAGTASDTAIRVAYRNLSSGACSNGSAWQNASYDARAAPRGWSP